MWGDYFANPTKVTIAKEIGIFDRLVDADNLCFANLTKVTIAKDMGKMTGICTGFANLTKATIAKGLDLRVL
jgi:hypothetical protein